MTRQTTFFILLLLATAFALTPLLFWSSSDRSLAQSDTFDFTTASNYDFTGTDIEIVGGVAQLVNQSASFTQNWQVLVDGSSATFNEVERVVEDSEGNIIIVGHEHNTTTGFDWYVAKINGVTGATIWDHTFDAGDNDFDSAQDVVIDSNDDVIVAGFADDGTNEGYIAKYAKDGDGGGNHQITWSDDNAEGFLQVELHIGDSIAAASEKDVYRYTSGGTLSGSTDISGEVSALEDVTDLVVDSSGNIIVSTRSNDFGTQEGSIVSVGPTGGINWSFDPEDDIPLIGENMVMKVDVDGFEQVVFAGFGENAGETQAYLVSGKLNGTTGALVQFNDRSGDLDIDGDSAELIGLEVLSDNDVIYAYTGQDSSIFYGSTFVTTTSTNTTTLTSPHCTTINSYTYTTFTFTYVTSIMTSTSTTVTRTRLGCYASYTSIVSDPKIVLERRDSAGTVDWTTEITNVDATQQLGNETGNSFIDFNSSGDIALMYHDFSGTGFQFRTYAVSNGSLIEDEEIDITGFTSEFGNDMLVTANDEYVFAGRFNGNNPGFVASFDFGTAVTYAATNPTIESDEFFYLNAEELVNFEEVLGGSHVGEIEYQISHNGGYNWYYHNGSAWTLSATAVGVGVIGSGYPTETNTATEVLDNLSAFPYSEPGKFAFRAFFISDGSQQVALDGLCFESDDTGTATYDIEDLDLTDATNTRALYQVDAGRSENAFDLLTPGSLSLAEYFEIERFNIPNGNDEFTGEEHANTADILVDSSNNLIEVEIHTFESQVRVTKSDPNGNEIWEDEYSVSHEIDALQAVVDDSDNIYIFTFQNSTFDHHFFRLGPGSQGSPPTATYSLTDPYTISSAFGEGDMIYDSSEGAVVLMGNSWEFMQIDPSDGSDDLTTDLAATCPISGPLVNSEDLIEDVANNVYYASGSNHDVNGVVCAVSTTTLTVVDRYEHPTTGTIYYNLSVDSSGNVFASGTNAFTDDWLLTKLDSDLSLVTEITESPTSTSNPPLSAVVVENDDVFVYAISDDDITVRTYNNALSSQIQTEQTSTAAGATFAASLFYDDGVVYILQPESSLSNIVLWQYDGFATYDPYIEFRGPIPYSSLASISNSFNNDGSLSFQLASDGDTLSTPTFRYHNGASWVSASTDVSETNTLAEVNTHIGSFPTPGDLVFRIFFTSDGTEDPILSSLTVNYTPTNTDSCPTPVATTTTSTGSTPEIIDYQQKWFPLEPLPISAHSVPGTSDSIELTFSTRLNDDDNASNNPTGYRVFDISGNLVTDTGPNAVPATPTFSIIVSGFEPNSAVTGLRVTAFNGAGTSGFSPLFPTAYTLPNIPIIENIEVPTLDFFPGSEESGTQEGLGTTP